MLIVGKALRREFAVPRTIKIGRNGFHVAVQPLRDGGFTFVVAETDLSGRSPVETRYDSNLRFDTEEAAYEGGSAYVRRRAGKSSR